MAGRKRKPDALKVVTGTLQKCRTTQVGRKNQVTKLPPPPRDWGKSAKKIYKVAAEQMRLYGLLTPENLPQLTAYAAEMGKYFDLETEIRLEGYTVVMNLPMGAIRVANTKIKIASTALKNATRLAQEFGLTPASLGRVGGSRSNEGDDYERFLRNG